jgi:hypothetical protein
MENSQSITFLQRWKKYSNFIFCFIPLIFVVGVVVYSQVNKSQYVEIWKHQTFPYDSIKRTVKTELEDNYKFVESTGLKINIEPINSDTVVETNFNTYFVLTRKGWSNKVGVTIITQKSNDFERVALKWKANEDELVFAFKIMYGEQWQEALNAFNSKDKSALANLDR